MSDAQQWQRNIYNYADKKANSVIHISECYVEAVNRAKKKVKIHLLPDLEDIGWVRLLMLNGNGSYSSGQLPEVDSTCVVLFPRGNKEMGICIAGGVIDDGETGSTLNGDYDMIITDKFGNKVHIRQDKIRIEHGTKIEVNAPLIVLNDGVLDVARKTDFVASPFGNLPIIGGSSTVKA